MKIGDVVVEKIKKRVVKMCIFDVLESINIIECYWFKNDELQIGRFTNDQLILYTDWILLNRECKINTVLE